jgi:hypothetical protein
LWDLGWGGINDHRKVAVVLNRKGARDCAFLAGVILQRL